MEKHGCTATAKAWWTCLVVVALASALPAHAQEFSAWSVPENLGPGVNTASLDAGAFVAKKGLSIYFTSNRPGGFGGNDIWVSRRASVNDPWGSPENLGQPTNSSGNEQTPTVSLDGHRLYFASDRDGGFGGLDVYVSRRHDKRDDLGWQDPVNLGSEVNTPATEFGLVLFEDDATGTIILYFSSSRPGGLGGADIYASMLGADESFGAPELVVELSSPSNDQRPAIRRDGLEIFLDSNRQGSLGAGDVWVSTRGSTSDSWSPPLNLTVVNSTANEARPALSFDGSTLYWSSDRGGGFGGQDIYVSRRTRLHEDGDKDDGP
jgi:hypothetical protein